MIRKQPIRKPTQAPKAREPQFDWEDRNIYRWCIHHPAPVAARVFGKITGAVFGLPSIICLILWLVALRFETTAFYMAAGLTVIMLISLISCYVDIWLGMGRARITAKNTRWLFANILIVCTAYLISGSQSPLKAHFGGPIDSMKQWWLYFFDIVLRILTLDSLAILDWNLSDITPLTWQSRLVMVFFKILATIGIVEGIVRISKQFYISNDFYGTVQDCYWECSTGEDPDAVLTRQIVLDEELEPVPVKQFMAVLKESARSRS